MMGFYLLAISSRPALEPTQPPIQWLPGALSVVVNQLGHEAGHSPPISAKVKNAWSYTTIPHGMVLKQMQGQLYLYLF
jgi:hypothetical protein